jgi:hypothetical protein
MRAWRQPVVCTELGHYQHMNGQLFHTLDTLLGLEGPLSFVSVELSTPRDAVLVIC